MTRQKSSRDAAETLGSATELLIQRALQTNATKRITLNPSFLDDEKLPEAERIAVLQEVFHRNIRLRQIDRLAGYLSPVLAGSLPPNLLVYGPSGTGKSVTCLHFLSTLCAMSERQGIPFRYFYVDLTTPKTCFGALNELAIAVDGATRRYRKGIALEHMQEAIIAALSDLKGFACVVVDEADNVTNYPDLLLTFLAKTLPKRVTVKLSYIFLTNRLEWERTLDPRILSVLKKQDMIFEPYDAQDLQEILRIRVEKALDVRRLDDAAIPKIAAYASREGGDARKAVELLTKAVKVAEETSGRLTEVEVDAAKDNLEIDKTEELINALANQQRLALRACYLGLRRHSGRLCTGSAYHLYCRLCGEDSTPTLSQRRFSDIVSFLDLYGLVNAQIVSKGRYGMTRELSSSLPEEVVGKLLAN